MNSIKKGFLIFLIFINFYCKAQVGFGVKTGFQQSIPLVMRDSFTGKPTFSGAFHIYTPLDSNLKLVTGIGYRGVSLGHKIESSGLIWQTLGLNLGAEWNINKFKKTRFYAGLNANYIYFYGKSILAGGSSSGSSYLKLKMKNKVVPSFELGLTFNPRPYFNITISTIQPIVQTINNGKPSLPGTLSFGIEYRITTRDIKNRQKDTSPMPEIKFYKNLKSGTLYFYQDGTDSSSKIFKDTLAKYFEFCKTDFIAKNNLNKMLDSFSLSADSNHVFIVKIGTVVYDLGRAATHGLIIYNYKMGNPVPSKPFFIRNLTGDSLFEDPMVVKNIINKLNYRLFNMYNYQVR